MVIRIGTGNKGASILGRANANSRAAQIND